MNLGFILLLALLSLCMSTKTEDGYVVMIDAGSTGSRAFIYHVTEVRDFIDNSTKSTVISRKVTSTKGKKCIGGLSTFADSAPVDIANYLSPMFVNASKVIPTAYHSTTQVFMKGTAGMRLLPQEKQDRLWNVLCRELNRDARNPFTIKLENLGTIDGHSEAFFAALSANYIAKSIDGTLRRVPGTHMVGALDMGGSSTQMIIHQSTTTTNNENEPVQQSDFWSHSWMNFGAEKIKEKTEDYLVDQFMSRFHEDVNEDGQAMSNEDGAVYNPCTPKGYEHTLDSGVTLTGSGHFEQCLELLKAVVWPDDKCPTGTDKASLNKDTRCYLDAIEHPPLRGPFYAMSVYFYALDAVRHLGDVDMPNWPTPTLTEIKEAVQSFCSNDWTTAQTWMGRAHRYTTDRNVPNRCIEASYVVTLMEHGFGIDANSRNIRIALNIEGHEVEWTLGFLLANVSLPPKKSLEVGTYYGSIRVMIRSFIQKLVVFLKMPMRIISTMLK